MKSNDYRRIMDGIKPDKMLKKQVEERVMSRHHYIAGNKVTAIIIASLGIAVLLVLMFGIPMINGGSLSDHTSLQLFVMTAYASGTEQPSALVDVQLKPDVKIVIGSYTPAMSSVPGFPFYGQCKNADRIEVEADSGCILLWSETDYTITIQGKRYTAKPNEKVYWSVLDESGGDTASQQATLTFTAYSGDKKLGEQKVLIRQGQDFLYTAEFVN